VKTLQLKKSGHLEWSVGLLVILGKVYEKEPNSAKKQAVKDVLDKVIAADKKIDLTDDEVLILKDAIAKSWEKGVYDIVGSFFNDIESL